MKHFKVFVGLSILLAGLAGCIEKPPIDHGLDLSFTFATRSEMTLTVTACNEQGAPSPGVLFSVYAENPYTPDGERILKLDPIYRGYTETGGKLTVKLSVPNSCENLYIAPDYAGYGTMQKIGRSNDNMAVTLKGASFTTKAFTKSAAAATHIERERIMCGTNYKFYRYFTSPEDFETDYGVLIPGGELVSQELISNDFKDLVSTWFPEDRRNFDTSICSDVLIEEDGTEVWITYLSDGGYTSSSSGNNNCLNSLMYYTYPNGSEMPTIRNEGELRTFLLSSPMNNLTYALINVHPDHTACGTKVQLLYWNGEKYVSEFPAGTKLGFAFLLNGYRKGDTRTFSLNTSYIKFSTPQMNRNGEAHSVILKSEAFNCYILGLEWGATADRDYNDILAKLEISSPVTIETEQETPEEFQIANTYHGTLAFEDIWPYEGDYDLNDFVADYKYEFIKVKGTNSIYSIKMIFTPKANGAADNNGFGMEVPLPSSFVTATGANMESENTNATVIVLPDIRSAFGGIAGNINTFGNLPYVPSTPITVTLTFNTPVPELQIPISSLNPFIFPINNRGKEIHLVDHAPTSKGNLALLGQGADKSNPMLGIYYRMDNHFPWALDIASSGINNWKYPLEMVKITDAYLHFSDWAEDHDISWFDWTVPGNTNPDKLYPLPPGDE